MGKLIIDQNKIDDKVAKQLQDICPFGAMEYHNGKMEINSACRTCKLCVKRGPQGVVTYVEEEEVKQIDKSIWKNIAVFVEIDLDEVHPVVFELIGKAKELVQVTKQEVIAVMIANKEQVEKHKHEVLSYGVDKLYVYENELFEYFNIERFSAAMEHFVNNVHPSVILYGGTPLGRSFAPRIAGHFKTGLTADCTKLGMKENTDLIQVRPAFGGNIMAQIICSNSRPQMATVRYKVFKKPEKVNTLGEVIYMDSASLYLESRIELLNIKRKEKVEDIADAEVIIACGRAFQTQDELNLAYELAELLNGVVAVSRPLVESGFVDSKLQIGLSGKTVAPKLIITLGISGAIQFVSGMRSSETIISVNKDPKAPIFEVAHYGIVDDVFRFLPNLIAKIKKERGLQ